MLIREYNESDLDTLRAIHAAQGFEYALPDLCNPLFVTKLVLSDVDGPPGFSSASSQVCHSERRADEIGPQSRYSSASCRFCARNLSSNRSHETTNELRGASETLTPYGGGNGRILGAALLRVTAEAYLLLDPHVGTPRERWQWLLALHDAARCDAWQRGLEDVHAWLPPPIARKFGRRLERLGWRRDDAWMPYCKRLG